MGRTSSVLVVDDDPCSLECTTLLLRQYGYSVFDCGSAGDGLAVVRDNPIDAVLTDIRMPKVSGIELLEIIQKESLEIPVILMTGYDVEIQRNIYDTDLPGILPRQRIRPPHNPLISLP